MEQFNRTVYDQAPMWTLCLSKSAAMVEDEVRKAKTSMKTKQCELNAIPTSLLKLLV